MKYSVTHSRIDLGLVWDMFGVSPNVVTVVVTTPQEESISGEPQSTKGILDIEDRLYQCVGLRI